MTYIFKNNNIYKLQSFNLVMLNEDEKIGKFQNRIKKIATSNFVLIPKTILDELDLKPEDAINVEISKASQYHVYICSNCKHSFEGEFINPVCPNCNINEDGLRIIDDLFKNEPKKYRCRLCQNIFESMDDVVYCPVCDSEYIEVIENE